MIDIQRLLVGTLICCYAFAIPTISVHGSKFFDSDGNQFFIKGSVQFRALKSFVTDQEGVIYQGNSTNTTLGEYNDHVAKIGMPYRIEEYDNSSNLYRLTVDKVDRYNIGTDHDFVKIIRRTELNYDGNSGHKDVSTEYGYDDANGNVLTKTEWGEVTGSADGSFADTGSDKRITTYT